MARSLPPRNRPRAWGAALLLLIAGCGVPAQKPVAPQGPEGNTAPVAAAYPDLPAANPPHTGEPARKPRIAIIIDDIGNNAATNRQAVQLPGPVALAILPHTPYAVASANAAHALGKPVLLHMPMSNTGGHALGADGLTPDMDRTQFARTLADAIHSIPYLEGLNNHMGSELTAMDQPMDWLMEELHHYPLYFIDSRTTAASVAARHANAAGIPFASRRVFLDNEANRNAIDFWFKNLLLQARKEGSAIGIGHPYPQTMAYLKEALPYLPALGFELVPPSQLLVHPAAATPAGLHPGH